MKVSFALSSLISISRRSLSSGPIQRRMPNKNVLEFMLILGNLKKHKRTGWALRNVPSPESISDHMYRMAIMSMLLDGNSTPENATAIKIDKERCLKIALVHDMCEAITGDITPHCGVSVEDKHRMEKAAMLDMCSNLSKPVADEILSLYEEYESQSTPEAQTVKDLDRFEMILQAFEYEKQHKREGKPMFLQEFYDTTKGKFRNPQVCDWVKQLNDLRSAYHVEQVSTDSQPLPADDAVQKGGKSS